MNTGNFTYVEMNIMIYNGGTRHELISALLDISGYLEEDEAKPHTLPTLVLAKLYGMSDGASGVVEFTPEFDINLVGQA